MLNKTTVRQTANIVALLITIAVNGLANSVKFNGRTTGDVANSFGATFLPANYVFGIWGLIYLGLLAFGVYQVLPNQRNNPRLERVGYWFVLSCAGNTAWIFCWHYGLFALSMVAMLVILVSLLMSYLALGVGREPVSAGEKICVHIPFSIYLAWITVATIANATVVLIDAGWNGGGIAADVWTVVLLGVATVIGLAVALPRNDWAFLAVYVWAFSGIAARFSSNQLLVVGGFGTAAIVAVALLLALFRSLPRRPRFTAQQTGI